MTTSEGPIVQSVDSLANVSFQGRNLRTPAEIAKMTLGKPKRSALYDIVHLFRVNHGWKDLGTPPADPVLYNEAVEKHQSIDPACPFAAEIEDLSAPATYLRIQHAGRMRVYQGMSSMKLAEDIAPQIRAALCWWSSLLEDRSRERIRAAVNLLERV